MIGFLADLAEFLPFSTAPTTIPTLRRHMIGSLADLAEFSFTTTTTACTAASVWTLLTFVSQLTTGVAPDPATFPVSTTTTSESRGTLTLELLLLALKLLPVVQLRRVEE